MNNTKEMPDFKAMAKRAIKLALVRHDMTYGDLIARLAEHGIEEKEGALRNKISRGTFTAAYFLQLLWVMGECTVEIRSK